MEKSTRGAEAPTRPAAFATTERRLGLNAAFAAECFSRRRAFEEADRHVLAAAVAAAPS